MLISDDYRTLNAKLHEDRPDYGASGHRWGDIVRGLAAQSGCESILDYGCGKRTLELVLGKPIRNYDPCISGLDSPPERADLVVCTDVLEHVEPEHLDAVLDDLARVTGKIGFYTVATRPAKKVLADGRNAHLIQDRSDVWLPKFLARFRLRQFQDMGGEFFVVVMPK